MFHSHFIICILLIFAVTPSCCQYETINCNLKPGYHVTTSEDTNESKSSSEFPLTCKQKSLGGFVSILSGNRRQINSLRKEISAAKLKNINQEQKLKELEGQVESLKQVNEKLADGIDFLTRRLNSLTEILQLSEGEKNKFDKKYSPDALKVEPNVKENCDVIASGICYLIITNNNLDVTFPGAVGICNAHNSHVATFRNKEAYDKVVNYIRLKIPVGSMNILVWTAVVIDAKAGTVKNKPLPYTTWKKDALHIGESYSDYTNVYLEVLKQPSKGSEGMGNFLPSSQVHGVVCKSTS